MANIQKGSFSLNLGFMTLGGELGEEDRQCAWEIYTEISTRVSLIGKLADEECTNFSGEIFSESLNSTYTFLSEVRAILRKYPVGKILATEGQHLGVITLRLINQVIRPFLEKWQSSYRYWWENQSNPRLTPFQRQSEYPQIDELLSDWSDVRWLMRKFQDELISNYKLMPING